jgi:hypothetical protein
VLCTYPIEHMAAVTPRVNPDATVALYDALAVHAGVRRPVVVDDPRVAADVLVHDNGNRFAWLVSHAAEPVTVKPVLSPGLTLATLDGEAAGDSVTLPTFGVGVFRMDGPAGRGTTEPSR